MVRYKRVRHDIPQNHINKLTTRSPRKIWNCNETVDKVKQSPTDNDAIVDVKEKHNRHCGITNTHISNRKHLHLIYREDKPI